LGGALVLGEGDAVKATGNRENEKRMTDGSAHDFVSQKAYILILPVLANSSGG
jgi:hypothetical protein